MIAAPNLHPKTLDILFQFEGKPRLTAQLCEGGRYEVAYGVTYYLDGSPVKAGDTITDDQVMPLTLHALAVESDPIWEALTREVTPFQAGALALLGYNVGGHSAAKSSVVRCLNEGRYEDAAAAFSMWTGATSSGPTPREIKAGIAPDFPTWSRETGRWLSPDGEPTRYFRRFRGLLRRHHASACLFMGVDWKEATKNDAVEMAVEPVWNAAKKRWEDRIIRQTEFPSIYAVARKYPLANVPINSAPDAPVAPAPTVPVEVAPLPEIKKPVEAEPVKEVPAKPETKVEPPLKPAKKPAQPFQNYDPEEPPKSVALSKRVYGFWLILVGWVGLIGEAFNDMGMALAEMPFVKEIAAMNPIQLKDWKMGVLILMCGFILYWYGQVKAKGPLK